MYINEDHVSKIDLEYADYLHQYFVSLHSQFLEMLNLKIKCIFYFYSLSLLKILKRHLKIFLESQVVLKTMGLHRETFRLASISQNELLLIGRNIKLSLSFEIWHKKLLDNDRDDLRCLIAGLGFESGVSHDKLSRLQWRDVCNLLQILPHLLEE